MDNTCDLNHQLEALLRMSRLPTKEKAAVEWCEKGGVEGSIEMIFVPVREGNFELSTDAP